MEAGVRKDWGSGMMAKSCVEFWRGWPYFKVDCGDECTAVIMPSVTKLYTLNE